VDASPQDDTNTLDWRAAAHEHHARTGRPYVVLRIAATLDGRTTTPDGDNRHLMDLDARIAAHQLRADSDAVLVGARTVRSDDPALTTRLVDGPNPRRVVLGTAPADAKIHPCLEWTGALDELLDHLGAEGVRVLLVEGGASTSSAFHHAGLVDRYVFQFGPTIAGGDDAKAMFAGPGAAVSDLVWRGRIESVRRLGSGVEVVVVPLVSDDDRSPG
jgi:diaminohydroxyphosphoribosylaminopyrimidine deaminase/5-amino-6-(5-phosphoribosylamino)uracil reductase